MGKAVFRGMRRAIAALADAGNDLIVDDVIWGRNWLIIARCCRAMTSGRWA
ncbi:MAG TPA: hypothetical protein VGF42_06245 [Caulobacteraceae bacterium]